MKINHDLKTALWCGPAAISAVTGAPTSQIVALAKKFTGRQVIKGMNVYTLRQVLNALGYRTEEAYSALRAWTFERGSDLRDPTLAKWTRENREKFSRLPCIVMTTSHYVTVKGRSFIDNHTKKPVPLSKAPWRRARVAQAWQVQKVEGPVLEIAPPVKSTMVTTGKTAALRLAKLHSIEVTPEDDLIWVYPPPALTDESVDQYAGDHAAYDWADALQRVQGYVEDLKKVTCV